MKLKNIKVGDFIEAKNTHGGDTGHNILEVGKSYEVLGFNGYSDLSVIISVPNHRTFHDGFYVSHEYFRKPKLKQVDQSKDIAKELLEVDLTSELCKAMLARGDKYVMCFVNDKDEEAAKNYKRVRVIHSHGVDYFDDTTEDMWDFAIPINNQGEPLTARDVGI